MISTSCWFLKKPRITLIILFIVDIQNMSKVVFKHLISLLIINLSYAQESNYSSIFIGHAYGSHTIKDQMVDSSIVKFLNDKKIDFNSVIFGGDFL